MIEAIETQLIDLIKNRGYQPPAQAFTDDHGIPFLVLPKDLDLKEVENLMERPVRRREKPTFVDAGDFSTYVAAQKLDGTIIFASRRSLAIKASIEHPKDGKADPSWQEHVPSLQLQRDPDWKRWNDYNEKQMGQNEFAEFIESMGHTIIEPESARIIEMVEKMRVTSAMSFDSTINRTTGAVSMHYKDDVKQVEGDLKLPTNFAIYVAPFESANPVNVQIGLRWRHNAGKVTFSYSLVRPDIFEKECWETVCNLVEEKTACPVLQVA